MLEKAALISQNRDKCTKSTHRVDLQHQNHLPNHERATKMGSRFRDHIEKDETATKNRHQPVLSTGSDFKMGTRHIALTQAVGVLLYQHTRPRSRSEKAPGVLKGKCHQYRPMKPLQPLSVGLIRKVVLPNRYLVESLPSRRRPIR